MSQTTKVHAVFTDALPRICYRSKCLESTVPGKCYCRKHAPENLRTAAVGQRYTNDSVNSLRTGMVRTIATIYLVKIISQPYMKIGRTKNLKSRIRSLQNGMPFEIRIFAAIKAPCWLEEKLHDYFKKDRIRGEWFKTSGEMYRIANMLQEGFKTEIYDLLEESGL